LGYDVNLFEIIDPFNSDMIDRYAADFFNARQRKGITLREAKSLMTNNNYYGSMMVKFGDADSLIGGLTSHYPQTIRPALETIGVREDLSVVSGLYIVIIKRKILFFADTTVNVEPNAEQLAEIALSASEIVKMFDIEPKIAMLSFSNFGSARYLNSDKVKKAVEIVKEKRPELIIDGEMQADTAVVPLIVEKEFPFSKIKGDANVLIFPNLSAGNISYKLFERLTDAAVIGPILMGMKKPVHVLQRGADVDDIINMTAIAVVEANMLK
jgi:malate dehydrogenase (oxaloacetate-decarboxylating)(NADP+)